MKLYVGDTVALAHYFDDRLPTKADRVFREAERGISNILVPEIVIGEFVYIALKGRLKSQNPRSLIGELLEELGASSHLRQVGMTEKAWQTFLESTVPELHDRMIYAIARSESVEAIITNDEKLAGSGIPTIW